MKPSTPTLRDAATACRDAAIPRARGRRAFLCCCGAAAAGLFSGLALAPYEARAAGPWASDCRPALPAGADALRARTFDGIDAAQLWDMHCHLLGTGDSGSGCYLHPSLTSGFDVVERLRRRVILDAACVDAGSPSIDRAYVQRFAALTEAFVPGARWLLFAFEQAHDAAGRVQPDLTTVYVPDAYAAQVAAAHAPRFAWVASIHPYRADALAALRSAHAHGAVAVKWLPSSMNIDLREPRSLAFGEAATALGLPLVVHCGEEKAVPGARREDLVNPLHVRPLLERGVRVIVAHCASLGHAADLDRRSAPKVPAFDLFTRLMSERAFEGTLVGDISAVFQRNREPEVWRALLERAAPGGPWAARVLHGSDYPLPGLKWLTSLPRLVAAGLLAEPDLAPLEELREHNPLLFDLALKRCLRGRGGAGLANDVFATRRHFGSSPAVVPAPAVTGATPPPPSPRK